MITYSTETGCSVAKLLQRFHQVDVKLLEVVKHSLPVATVEEAQVVNATLLTLGAALELSLVTL